MQPTPFLNVLPAPELATPEAALDWIVGPAMEMLTACGVLAVRAESLEARSRLDLVLGDVRELVEHAVAVARGEAVAPPRLEAFVDGPATLAGIVADALALQDREGLPPGVALLAHALRERCREG